METSDKDKDLMGRMEETLRQLGLDGHDMHIASTTPVERLADIVPGDMVAVRRTDSNMTVHTGIYIGNGEVVDLWGPAKQSSTIDRRPYADFNYPSVGTVIVNFDAAFAKVDTVKIALAMVDRGRHISYNGRLRNCQHFATYCRTGRCEPVIGLIPQLKTYFK